MRRKNSQDVQKILYIKEKNPKLRLVGSKAKIPNAIKTILTCPGSRRLNLENAVKNDL